MIKRFLLTLVLGMLATGNIAASCASSPDNGGGYRGRNDYPDNDRPNRIPRWSDLVREGTGKLKWTADLDGRFYVYDAGADRIDYEGPVRRGQEIVVQPDDDKVYVAERVVYNENLRRDARHQLYFARERNDGNDGDRADRDDRGGRPSQQDEIPRGASRLVRGSENIQVKSMPRDGTAYLYDENDKKLIYTVDVRRNTSIQVIRSDRWVYVNGKRTKSINVDHGHTLSIYFKEN
jgi:hypothetical protein